MANGDGHQGEGGEGNKEGALAWADTSVLRTKAYDKFTSSPEVQEKKKISEYLTLFDALLLIRVKIRTIFSV